MSEDAMQEGLTQMLQRSNAYNWTPLFVGNNNIFSVLKIKKAHLY